MPLTRRGFAQTVGLGTAGILSNSFIIGRGLEAAEFEPESAQMPYDDGIIRISSNENARGPGPKAMQALHQTISVRAGFVSFEYGSRICFKLKTTPLWVRAVRSGP